MKRRVASDLGPNHSSVLGYVMKRLFATIFLLLASVAFSLDNEGWLEKACENATRGFLMDSDETAEDGVYCLVLSLVNLSSGESSDAQLGEAVLDAKKKITAFVKGEKVSASVSPRCSWFRKQCASVLACPRQTSFPAFYPRGTGTGTGLHRAVSGIPFHLLRSFPPAWVPGSPSPDRWFRPAESA